MAGGDYQTQLDDMITFIIPTVARPSLLRTLNSLVDQDDSHWKAIVVFDGIKPEYELIDDERISYLLAPRRLGTCHAHGQGGQVRNYGIRRATTNWIGFVDDDDTLSPDYLKHFYRYREQMPDLDMILFRMIMNGAVYPPDGWGIEECKVGISFCVSRWFLLKNNLWFANSDTEDYRFLASIRDSGAKYIIAPEITYHVNH